MIAKRKLSTCHSEPRVSFFVAVLWTTSLHFAATYSVCRLPAGTMLLTGALVVYLDLDSLVSRQGPWLRVTIREDYRIGTLSKINNIIYCKNDCLQSTT